MNKTQITSVNLEEKIHKKEEISVLIPTGVSVKTESSSEQLHLSKADVVEIHHEQMKT